MEIESVLLYSDMPVSLSLWRKDGINKRLQLNNINNL